MVLNTKELACLLLACLFACSLRSAYETSVAEIMHILSEQIFIKFRVRNYSKNYFVQVKCNLRLTL